MNFITLCVTSWSLLIAASKLSNAATQAPAPKAGNNGNETKGEGGMVTFDCEEAIILTESDLGSVGISCHPDAEIPRPNKLRTGNILKRFDDVKAVLYSVLIISNIYDCAGNLLSVNQTQTSYYSDHFEHISKEQRFLLEAGADIYEQCHELDLCKQNKAAFSHRISYPPQRIIRRTAWLQTREVGCRFVDEQRCAIGNHVFFHASKDSSYRIHIKDKSYKVVFLKKRRVKATKIRYSTLHGNRIFFAFKPTKFKDEINFTTSLQREAQTIFQTELPNIYFTNSSINLNNYGMSRSNKNEEVELYNEIMQAKMLRDHKRLQCEIEKFVEGFKLQFIHSKGYFTENVGRRDGLFSLIRGNKIMKVQCKKLIAQPRTVDGCYTDKPISVNGRKGFLDEISGIFLLDSEKIACRSRVKRSQTENFYQMFEVSSLATTTLKFLTSALFFNRKNSNMDFSKVFNKNSLNTLDKNLSIQEAGHLSFLQDILKRNMALGAVAYIGLSFLSILTVIMVARHYKISWVKSFSLVSKFMKVFTDLKRYRTEQQRLDKIEKEKAIILGEIEESDKDREAERQRQSLKKLQIDTLKQIKDQRTGRLSALGDSLKDLNNLEIVTSQGSKHDSLV